MFGEGPHVRANMMKISSLFLWIYYIHTAVPLETCHFPDFLQSTSFDGVAKPWSTRIWWLYIRHAPRSAEKQEITVKNGHMSRYREQSLQTCEHSTRRVHHKTSLGQCSDRQHVYNRTCISEERENTFKVIQYNADRTHRFTCMKFVKRSDNVVQVYEGPLSDLNDKNLCDEDGLHLDEWPWTAPVNDQPNFCAVSGGFSFRTIRRLTNEDLCEEEWRRSSLEVECIKGDGMDFIAPTDSNCNPFLKHGDWKRLTCWAGWTFGQFIFIVASDVGSQPRYCLRFPRVQEGEFTVLIYFSVICPTEADGKPPHGIEYYELKMFRKDPKQCHDDNSDKCREVITMPDMCVKDKVFAPHCPKTCGKCTTTTVSNINGRRCWLEPSLFGDWRLYEKSRTYDVVIDQEKATFSHMGSFQCLEVDNKGRRYKMASLFDNGCSHRYTCMEFIRRNNNVLQYRTSPSDRSELKMEDLCNFRDDPYPLTDFFRSFYFKNLILAKDLWPHYCGVNSVIPFNGTINGRQCTGNVSDWDEESCTTRGLLTLKSDTCKELILPMGFQCLAFIHDDAVPLQQLLLTRSLDGMNTYNCWILTKFIGGGHWPRPLLLQMPTVQCSLIMDVDINSKGDHSTSLYLDDAAKSRPCKAEVNRRVTIHKPEVNRSKDLPAYEPNQDEPVDTNIEVLLPASSPKTDPALTSPLTEPPNSESEYPDWYLYNTASARLIHNQHGQILVTLLMVLQLILHSSWIS